MSEKQYTILVTDDDKSNLMVLDSILSPHYKILMSKSGERALTIAKQYRPDLILLDILMPEMTGFEVIAKLKEDGDTAQIPVIFITGLADVDNEEKGLSSGAVDYITKPFSKVIVLARIKNHIKIINQMRIIENIGLTDPLTNIANRRGFENRLNAEWSRALRDRHPLSILMLDIDKFKDYNDTYGHQQGDAALQAVAQTLSKELKRSSDFAARWGGEEFIGLMPSLDSKGAVEVAEQLRKVIEKVVIPADGFDTKITVSIGINTVVPQADANINNFIKKADDALYKAKESGRNRVCMSK